MNSAYRSATSSCDHSAGTPKTSHDPSLPRLLRLRWLKKGKSSMYLGRYVHWQRPRCRTWKAQVRQKQRSARFQCFSGRICGIAIIATLKHCIMTFFNSVWTLSTPSVFTVSLKRRHPSRSSGGATGPPNALRARKFQGFWRKSTASCYKMKIYQIKTYYQNCTILSRSKWEVPVQWSIWGSCDHPIRMALQSIWRFCCYPSQQTSGRPLALLGGLRDGSTSTTR